MTDEALQNKEPALDDDIEQAMSELNGEDTELEQDQESQQEGQESESEIEQDAQAEAQEEDQATEEELEALIAPQHWKPEIQELFGKLGGVDGGRDWQQFLLDRHKDMEGDYTRKTQELADNRRQFETQFDEYRQYNDMIAPFAQQWQMQGMTPTQGVQQLLGYAQALQQDPQGTLLGLAKMYNVDLESAIGEQPYVDPQVQQLQEQLQQQESAFQQMQLQQQQEHHNATVQQIQQFAEATDEKGQLLRPHFETVYEQMVQLVQLGHAQDLETAYEKAVQLNPEIQSDLRKQEEAAAVQQRQVKANKAKKAAAVVETQSTESEPSTLSLEDEIGAAFDAQNI